MKKVFMEFSAETDISMDVTIVRTPYNPNFIPDFREIFNINWTESEVKKFLDDLEKENEDNYKKISRLLDRIEFIRHLQNLKDEIINSNYHLKDNEYNGVDSDINALTIYLSLTCINILFTTFKEFDRWLLQKISDEKITFVDNAEKFIKKYKRKYLSEQGMTDQFIESFKKAPESLRNEFEKNLHLRHYGDFTEVIRFLLEIRNQYTHAGIRVAFPVNGQYAIRIGECIDHNKNILKSSVEENELIVNNNFDLVSKIIEVAIAKAKELLKINEEDS